VLTVQELSALAGRSSGEQSPEASADGYAAMTTLDVKWPKRLSCSLRNKADTAGATRRASKIMMPTVAHEPPANVGVMPFAVKKVR
jgi:hypothetical protein